MLLKTMVNLYCEYSGTRLMEALWDSNKSVSLITVLTKKNLVRKTQKAGKWPKTYLFISNDREKVVESTLCYVVTETLLQLLFEGTKQVV